MMNAWEAKNERNTQQRKLQQKQGPQGGHPNRFKPGDQQARKAKHQHKHGHGKDEESVVSFPGNEVSGEDHEIPRDMSTEQTRPKETRNIRAAGN